MIKLPILFPPDMRQRLLELLYDALFLLRRTTRRTQMAWYVLTCHRVMIAEDSESADRVFEIRTEDCVTLDHVTYVARQVRLTDEVTTWCRENGLDPFLMASDAQRVGGSGRMSLFFRSRDEAFAFKMRWL